MTALDRLERWPQLTPVESEESKLERMRRRAIIACDLLLAKLFKNHPNHAMAALKGIQPNVVDLEPPPPPEPAKPSAEIIPLPGAEPTLADLIGKRPSMQTILNTVCHFYGVGPVDVCSDRRTHEVIKPRQVVMYFARKLTTNSTTAVGRILGGRDHSTVIHAARKIEGLIKSDERFSDEIEVLTMHIQSATLKAA